MDIQKPTVGSLFFRALARQIMDKIRTVGVPNNVTPKEIKPTVVAIMLSALEWAPSAARKEPISIITTCTGRRMLKVIRMMEALRVV